MTVGGSRQQQAIQAGREHWLRVVKGNPKVVPFTRPRLNKYIIHEPHATQTVFLLLNNIREILFGGAAGGGKSDALLMGALQYVDIPNYSALLLRRTTSDHKLPGSILDRAHAWLAGTDAKWRDRDKMYVFPSGAKIVFGFLEHEKDKFRYASAEFQFIGFDELTQFTRTMYTFMFSRMRRLKDSQVPIRMRAATNPIGEGADWVKERWGIEVPEAERDLEAKRRIFIPSKLEDNPSLDIEEYEESLNELDPITKAQLRGGDWTVRQSGGKFRREYFRIVDIVPRMTDQVRFWDLAGTEPEYAKDAPDWTVGCHMGMDADNNVFILDIVRFQRRPGDTEKAIRETAYFDGKDIRIRMEQEPGQSGVSQIYHYGSTVLAEFDFGGVRSSGDKILRSNPLSAAASRGQVFLLRGPWNEKFLAEAELFPLAENDDQVDAASGAREELFGMKEETALSSIYQPDFGRSEIDARKKQIRQSVRGQSRIRRIR